MSSENSKSGLMTAISVDKSPNTVKNWEDVLFQHSWRSMLRL